MLNISEYFLPHFVFLDCLVEAHRGSAAMRPASTGPRRYRAHVKLIIALFVGVKIRPPRTSQRASPLVEQTISSIGSSFKRDQAFGVYGLQSDRSFRAVYDAPYILIELSIAPREERYSHIIEISLSCERSSSRNLC